MNRVMIKRAAEELDANSTQEQFISDVSTVAADFIRTNRDAFDADDQVAIQELADVLAVPSVQEEIMSVLQTEPEVEKFEKEPEDDLVKDEKEDESKLDDGLVDKEVMQLLDE